MPFTVHVENFQSLLDVTVPVEGFTVITGTNNSGKSALMRAIRGAFQNAKGTSFIRHGKTKAVVEVSFADGQKVRWEKGKDKGDKPTYIVNDGKPVYPGQAVPDEVRALGVKPITAGGREIWPQFAPQFTGQVFLLDQPGSVLAEAVSDVNRVSQLNEALRMAESDRRAAASELRVRLTDQTSLEEEVKRYVGLDDAASVVDAIEADILKVNKVASAVQAVAALRDKLGTAQAAVEKLAGVESVDVPGDEAVRLIKDTLSELEGLLALQARLQKAQAAVTRYDGVPQVEDFDLTPVEKSLATLTTLEGLRDKLATARRDVANLEGQLKSADAELVQVGTEISTILEGMGECPLCGSTMEHTGHA